MALRPWSKFYWADWRADPRLRMCSLAARGLWVELCGLAHEADPYGHVLVAGCVPSPDQLASLVGAPLNAVLPALKELDEAGVFSRTPEGVIYSRRMVRAKDREEEGRDAVNRRWANSQPNRSPNRSPINEPITLEARSQNPDSVAIATGGKPPVDDRAWLFTQGLKTLAEHSGKPGASLRSVIGRWLKLTGDDPTAIRAEIEAATEPPAPVAEPIAWIEARLKPRGDHGKSKQRNARDNFHAGLAAAVAARSAGAGNSQGVPALPERRLDEGGGGGGVQRLLGGAGKLPD